MKRLLWFLAYCSVSVWANAQVVSPSQEYVLNPFYLSPSNAGINGNHNVFLGGLYHMAGIKGAPVAVSGNYNGLIKGGSAIGTKVEYESFGAFRNVNFDITYAYHLKLAGEHKLSAGLSFLAQQQNLDFSSSNSDPLNDPVLASGSLRSGASFNAGFGLSYSFRRVLFSASMVNVAPVKRNDKFTLFTPLQTLRFYTHYDIGVGANFALKPIVLVDYTLNDVVNFNGLVSLRYADKVWLNLGYGAGNLLSSGLGVLAADRFSIQYTFQYALSGLLRTTAGNHQLSIGVILGKMVEDRSTSTDKKRSKIPYHDWE